MATSIPKIAFKIAGAWLSGVQSWLHRCTVFMLIPSIKPTGDAQTIPPKWVFVPFGTLWSGFEVKTSSPAAAVAPSAIVAVCSTALPPTVAPAAHAARVRFEETFLATWIFRRSCFPQSSQPFRSLSSPDNRNSLTYPILIIPYTGVISVVWLLRKLHCADTCRDRGWPSRVARIEFEDHTLVPWGGRRRHRGDSLLERFARPTLTRSDVKTAP
jgi:hypothetical protein